MPAALTAEFQSTPLREGRLHGNGHRVIMREFQSTPLREGRRLDTGPSTLHS